MSEPVVFRSKNGVTIHVCEQNWQEWNWTETIDNVAQPLLAHAATIIGPAILEAFAEDAAVSSSVENGRFVGNFLALGYSLTAAFDPAEMIDLWVDPDTLEDADGRRDAEVVLAWLETQAARLREALKETES